MTTVDSTLPAPPEKLLSGLLTLMHDLKIVYTSEVDALKRNDTKAFLAVQPDKEILSRDYEIRVKEVQARSAAVKTVDAALREKIVVSQAELAVLADQSMRAAERMAESIRRLQDRLMGAARKAIAQEKIRYGAAGSMTESRASKPIATAINEAI